MPRIGRKLREGNQRFNREVGRRVEALMKKQGMTQRKLQATSGVKQAAISFLLNGKRGLPAPQLQRVAKALGVPYRDLVPDEAKSIVPVPFLGQISAGRMNLAEAVTDETIAVPDHLINTKEDIFALRVSGDSMTGLGILSGDVVIFRTGPYSINDIVAVTLDGVTALRRLDRDDERLLLRAANPANEDIEVHTDAKLTIHGVVLALIRSYEFKLPR